MRLRSSPGGVKVRTLPGKPEVWVRFPSQDSVFSLSLLYLPCVYHVIRIVKRMYS